jgi:hypothetical protein
VPPGRRRRHVRGLDDRQPGDGDGCGAPGVGAARGAVAARRRRGDRVRQDAAASIRTFHRHRVGDRGAGADREVAGPGQGRAGIGHGPGGRGGVGVIDGVIEDPGQRVGERSAGVGGLPGIGHRDRVADRAAGRDARDIRGLDNRQGRDKDGDTGRGAGSGGAGSGRGGDSNGVGGAGSQAGDRTAGRASGGAGESAGAGGGGVAGQGAVIQEHRCGPGHRRRGVAACRGRAGRRLRPDQYGRVRLRSAVVADLAGSVRAPAVGGARGALRTREGGTSGDLGHRDLVQRGAASGRHRDRRLLRSGGRAVPQLAAAPGTPAVGDARTGKRAGGRPADGDLGHRHLVQRGAAGGRHRHRYVTAGGRAVAQLAAGAQPPAVDGTRGGQRAHRRTAGVNLGHRHPVQWRAAGGRHGHRYVTAGGRAVAQLAAGAQPPAVDGTRGGQGAREVRAGHDLGEGHPRQRAAGVHGLR